MLKVPIPIAALLKKKLEGQCVESFTEPCSCRENGRYSSSLDKTCMFHRVRPGRNVRETGRGPSKDPVIVSAVVLDLSSAHVSSIALSRTCKCGLPTCCKGFIAEGQLGVCADGRRFRSGSPAIRVRVPDPTLRDSCTASYRNCASVA